MVRIPGFHPGDPGSSPGVGSSFELSRGSVEHESLAVYMPYRSYGATVARLTPDQTVGRSNRSGFNYLPSLLTLLAKRKM